MKDQPKPNLRCLHYLPTQCNTKFMCEKERNHKGVHVIEF